MMGRAARGILDVAGHSQARVIGKRARQHVADRVHRGMAAAIPYQFSYGRYPHTFLERKAPAAISQTPVARVIYVLWTGGNAMSQNRVRNLARLRDLDVPVDLVTERDLDRIVKDGAPIHPSYPDLSLIHRSDYLRAYLMHNHGGAYSDIKPPAPRWGHAFDRLEVSPDLDVIGPPELGAVAVAPLTGRLGRNLRRYHRLAISTNTYVCRPGSAFTAEWLREVERRLDYYACALSESPGNTLGNNPGYPVPWTALLGDVFHPLCLKHHERIGRDDSLRHGQGDYR